MRVCRKALPRRVQHRGEEGQVRGQPGDAASQQQLQVFIVRTNSIRRGEGQRVPQCGQCGVHHARAAAKQHLQRCTACEAVPDVGPDSTAPGGPVGTDAQEVIQSAKADAEAVDNDKQGRSQHGGGSAA